MEQQITQQRSEQWHRLRLGKFTSGHAYLFMSKKEVLTVGLKTYLTKKLWELVCGYEKEIKAWQLEHGNEWEPFAKKEVEKKYKSEYFDVELIQNPILRYHCGSPDGFITINGIDTTPEVKCPVGEQHLANIMHFENEETLKAGYPEIYWQCQSNMWLQNTKMALPVTFNAEAGDLMYKDLMLARNDRDIEQYKANMAIAWEWYQDKAKKLGIDILAKYDEYAQPKHTLLKNISEIAA